MCYTSGPGFDSQWRPNIFNSVLFKKACERERIHLKSDIISLDGGGVYFYGANQLSHKGSIYDGYMMDLIYEFIKLFSREGLSQSQSLMFIMLQWHEI